MRAYFAGVIVLFGVISSASVSPAAAARNHTIEQLAYDGKTETKDSDVTITPNNGQPVRGVKLGDPLPDGARIDVPAHVTVTLVSTGAKSRIVLSPHSSFTPLQTANGESSSMSFGQAAFSVVHGALDFFRVNMRNISASVPGTEFTIDASSDSSAFKCTDGAVDVVRVGSLAISGSAPSSVSNVRQTESVTAGRNSERRYSANADTLGTFDSLDAAKSAFEKSIADAAKTRDVPRLRAALMTVGILYAKLGKPDDALRAAQGAQDISDHQNDRDGVADGLYNVGTTQQVLGRFADAEKSFRKASGIFQQVGDREGTANAQRAVDAAQKAAKSAHAGTHAVKPPAHATKPAKTVTHVAQSVPLHPSPKPVKKGLTPAPKRGIAAAIHNTVKNASKSVAKIANAKHATPAPSATARGRTTRGATQKGATSTTATAQNNAKAPNAVVAVGRRIAGIFGRRLASASTAPLCIFVGGYPSLTAPFCNPSSVPASAYSDPTVMRAALATVATDYPMLRGGLCNPASFAPMSCYRGFRSRYVVQISERNYHGTFSVDLGYTPNSRLVPCRSLRPYGTVSVQPAVAQGPSAYFSVTVGNERIPRNARNRAIPACAIAFRDGSGRGVTFEVVQNPALR